MNHRWSRLNSIASHSRRSGGMLARLGRAGGTVEIPAHPRQGSIAPRLGGPSWVIRRDPLLEIERHEHRLLSVDPTSHRRPTYRFACKIPSRHPGCVLSWPASLFPVAYRPPVGRSADAEFAKQLRPPDTGLGHKEDSCQAEPVVDACPPTPRIRRCLRDQRLGPFPQRTRDHSSIHASSLLGRRISSHDHIKSASIPFRRDLNSCHREFITNKPGHRHASLSETRILSSSTPCTIPPPVPARALSPVVSCPADIRTFLGAFLPTHGSSRGHSLALASRSLRSA